MLLAGSAWRTCHAAPVSCSAWCRPPSCAASQHQRRVRACSSSQGLYQVPGLSTPDAWQDVVQRAKAHCAHVVEAHLAGQLGPAATWDALTNIMDGAQLPTAHAAEHHPDPAWRAAAHGARAQLADVGAALASALSHLAPTQQGQQQDHPGREVAPGVLGDSLQAATLGVVDAHALGTSYNAAGMSGGGGREPMLAVLPGGQPSAEAAWQAEVVSAQQAEALLCAQLGRAMAACPAPWLVLHESELGAGVLHSLPGCTVSASHQPGAPVSMHSLQAAMLHCRRRPPAPSVRLVWRVSGAGRRARGRWPGLRCLRLAQAVQRHARVHGCPARSRHHTCARSKHTVPAGKSIMVSVPISTRSTENGNRRAVWVLRVCMGHHAHATQIAAAAVAAWRKQQRGQGVADPRSTGLVAVRLTQQVTRDLLAAHPSRSVRRAVYRVGLRQQVARVARAAHALQPLRQAVAQLYGAPSYAHLRLAGTSAGEPRAVSCLLKELAGGLRPLVQQQVGEGAALMQRAALAAGSSAASGNGVLQPWDMELACELGAGMHSAGSAAAWRDVAPHLSVQGVMSAGLTRLLGSGEWSLQLAQVAQGEVWVLPGGAPPPLKVHLVGRRELRGGAGQVRGVIYLLPDATSQPFTTLIRPGALAGVPELEPLAGTAAKQPAVAIHLPAAGLASVDLPGAGGSLTLLRSPLLLRALLHEAGHALSYCVSAHAAVQRGEPRGCVCYAGLDVREVASHVLERAVYDAAALAALSCAPAPGGCGLHGPSLPLQVAEQLADHVSALLRPSPWQLQQHALAALVDTALHAHPASRGRVSRGGLGGAGLRPPPQLARLMAAAWARNSSAGRLVLTSQLATLLQGLLFSPSAMWAYPTALLLSSALWSAYALAGQPGGSGWAQLCQQLLAAPGSAQLHDVMAATLGGEGVCRPVTVDGEVVGVIPDLAHPAFQDIDF